MRMRDGCDEMSRDRGMAVLLLVIWVTLTQLQILFSDTYSIEYESRRVIYHREGRKRERKGKKKVKIKCAIIMRRWGRVNLVFLSC